VYARVSCVYQQRGGNNRSAQSAERERYDGGDINDLSMDNLSLVFLLWCKNVSQIFEKRNSPLTAPPQKTTTITNDHNYEAKECNRWSNTKNIERTKRTEEQKKEKKKENHTTNVFIIRHIIFHTPQQTHEFFQQRDSLTLFCETKKEKETARDLKEVHVYIFSFAKERLLFVIKNTSKSESAHF
jgi:hypothetical protein